MENETKKEEIKKKMPTYTGVYITPALARRYLASNDPTRVLSGTRIDTYARDMKNGHWEEFNPSSQLIFDKEGHLVDGQHRLRAVIKSGATIGFMTAVSDCKMIDLGQPRTVGQMSKFMGKEINGSEAAVARCYFEYIMEVQLPSQNEVIDFVLGHRANIDNAIELSRAGKKTLCAKAPIQFAAFLALEAGYKIDVMKRFFEAANTGYQSEAGEIAAITFRNQLIKEGYSNGRAARKRWCSIAQEALWLHAKGKARKSGYKGNKSPYKGDVQAKLDLARGE